MFTTKTTPFSNDAVDGSSGTHGIEAVMSVEIHAAQNDVGFDEPLGTILTRKLGPRWFLASIALAWGAAMIGNGFVNSWESLAGLRILIGVLEAGYFPGAVYLLSTWYTRFDMQKRYVGLYGVGCVAGALGGILAYGLSQMDGLAGLRGWRWIFIIEGVISCLIALASYIFLVGFPEEADKSWRFLSKEECDFIIRRVNRDRGDAITEPFSLRTFFESAADWKIWVYAFMFFCVTTVGLVLGASEESQGH
ncbi:hypothetical protein SLS62_006513 [Diatrype stigma]|uniref:Major facilitator superfamily (MFS) profile domain-containing protein n=1 Tax=Diatrype stigma TaxID=117547 RepID=A0AAN9YMS3_9PEZI